MAYNKNGLPSKALLDKLSFKSSLNKNLKQLSVRLADVKVVQSDLADYSTKLGMMPEATQLIAYRIKSGQSLQLKYQKYIERGAKAALVFNDILGIRVAADKYPTQIPDYFNIVDLRRGKNIDDGYRAIHLYYQKDTYHYPIEVQLWCGNDLKFNVLSHIHLYKYSNPEIGRRLRGYYDKGLIGNEAAFFMVLHQILNGRA